MIKKIISGTIASIAFLSPSYAQEISQENTQQEKFNSVFELEMHYKTQVRESLSDGLLSHEEIVRLDKLLTGNFELIAQEKPVDYSKEFFNHPLSDLINKYPGLFGEQDSAVYLANQKLSSEEKKDLISKIEDKEILKYFTDKEELTLQDLAIAYTNIQPIQSSDNAFLARDLRSQLSFLSSYLQVHKNCKTSDFNTKPYLSVGILPFFVIKQDHTGKYNSASKELAGMLSKYAKLDDVKITEFEKEFPNFYKTNLLNFLKVLACLFGPAILRSQIKKYRKDEKWTEIDEPYHIFDCLFCVFGMEAFHYSISYVRFGIPVVWETLKGLKK